MPREIISRVSHSPVSIHRVHWVTEFVAYALIWANQMHHIVRFFISISFHIVMKGVFKVLEIIFCLLINAGLLNLLSNFIFFNLLILIFLVEHLFFIHFLLIIILLLRLEIQVRYGDSEWSSAATLFMSQSFPSHKVALKDLRSIIRGILLCSEGG